jgi:hypothetical protein
MILLDAAAYQADETQTAKPIPSRFLYFEGFLKGDNANQLIYISPEGMPQVAASVEEIVRTQYSDKVSAVQTGVSSKEYQAIVCAGDEELIARIGMFHVSSRPALIICAYLSATEQYLPSTREIMSGLVPLLAGFQFNNGDGLITLHNDGKLEANGRAALDKLEMYDASRVRMDLLFDGTSS